jgi:Ca2+-binding RTX toxin-like protein
MIKIDVAKHKFGSPVNDYLYGSDGDEIFHHSAGNDHYYGGNGYDTLTFASSDKAVIVDARGETGTTLFFDNTETDSFVGIEKIVGSQHDDVFWAGATTEMDGGAGDDWILSGSGANKLQGGTGIDTVSYTDSTGAVDVQLLSSSYLPRALGGWAEGDTLSGFENVRGSNFDDVIGGDLQANTLWGNGGDDLVRGLAGDDKVYGDEGDDFLFGGDGRDGLDGGEGNDTLWGEQGDDALVGGIDHDLLSGGAGNDDLFGGDGTDALYGGSGSDDLFGQAGADTHWGGSGADQFIFMSTQDSRFSANGQPGADADKIMDFSQADGDKINLASIDADMGRAGHQSFTDYLLETPDPSSDSFFAAGTIAVSHYYNDTYVQINTIDSENAEGVDAPEMVIVLAGHHDLTTDDFILTF